MKARGSAGIFLSSGTVQARAARRSGELDHRFPGSESGHELTARTGHGLRVIAEQAGTGALAGVSGSM